MKEYVEKTGGRAARGGKLPLSQRLAKAFVNPFIAILSFFIIASSITDIIMAEPGEEDPLMVIIISVVLMFFGFLRFVNNEEVSF